MQQALLGATTEVESAIANDQATREQRAVTDEQAEAAQLAWESATARYLEGVEPFVTVLGAQTALANAQISQLTAHRDTLAARVALHDALGGPWATRTSP
jgi:multidrug efflux system outer membrane protein